MESLPLKESRDSFRYYLHDNSTRGYNSFTDSPRAFSSYFENNVHYMSPKCLLCIFHASDYVYVRVLSSNTITKE